MHILICPIHQFSFSEFALAAFQVFLIVDTLLLQPCFNALSISVSIKVHSDFLCITSWVELQGWVSSDINSFHLVDCRVKLGEDEAWHVFELSGHLVPDGGELLAVSAPRGVEFDQHVGLGVQNDIIETLTDDDLNWFTVISWNLF